MPRHLPSSSRSPAGERSFLRLLQAQAEAQVQGRARQIRTGIGDDCAVLRVPPGHELCVTTDLLLETTHFRRDWHAPEAAGHRCLARGLSDLAAMGARPLAAFLSLAVPGELAGGWVTRFLQGLLALARYAGVPLAGGDTAQAPILPGASGALFSADIILLGTVPAGAALLRSGARAGDRIYVTGALGGAAAELARIAARPASVGRFRTPAPDHPHLFPEPRLRQGERLRTLASAAIDLSDGLSTDLAHLCEASGVRAEIDAAGIPLHPLAASAKQPLDLALHGGEDYELLFTAPEGARIPRTIVGVPVHAIGRVRRSRKGAPTVTLQRPDGRAEPLASQGWEHFRSRPFS